MIKSIKRMFLKMILNLHIMGLRLGIAMRNSEDDVSGENSKDDTKGKIQIRKTHRNAVLEKMLQGERDEQYVKDYYEILRKADKFMRNASAKDIEMAADKYGMSYGKKDRWGRRYEHYGFFDSKHKYAGKSLVEAMEMEVKEKVTKDEDFEIEFMFDNKPIVDGYAGLNEMKQSDRVTTGYEAMNPLEKARARKFPMSVMRDNQDSFNKIEMLTSFLHVKKITGQDRVLEFFIPKKFKLHEHMEKSEIFNDLIDIKTVWIKDEYDGRYGFAITGYRKYIDFEDKYDVLKFNAVRIRNLDKNE